LPKKSQSIHLQRALAQSDTENAEALRTDALDPRMNDASWLVHGFHAAHATTGTVTDGHGTYLQVKGLGISHFSCMAGR
jgi:hypothetical protein